MFETPDLKEMGKGCLHSTECIEHITGYRLAVRFQVFAEIESLD